MIALVALSQAMAGGYYYSESGIAGTARGGAVIASTRDQFAQHHNPAGLIHVDAPTVNLGWSGVQQKVFFDRLGEDETFLPTAENQAAPFNVPQLGFATPLGKNLAFAFGFTSPFAPSSDYDPDGPQRYTIIDTSIYQFSLGPSMAWRPLPWLTVGAGLQWQVLLLGQRLDVTLSGEDDPEGDVGIDIRVNDTITPNANIGLLFDPHEAVTIGLSVQPGTGFNARGTATLDFTGNRFESLIAPPGGCEDTDDTACPRVFNDDDVGVRVSLPWVFRAGVAVRPVPKLELEVAAVYQLWRALSEITVEDIDVSLDVAVLGETAVNERFDLPASLRDTLSLRLGGEYRIVDELSWRAGGFYETGAIADTDLSVALYDPAKVQVGTGAQVRLLDDRLRFDTSFAWLFFPKKELRESTVSQINAEVADPDLPLPGLSNDALIVGNGDLRAYGWIVGIQASWRFAGKKQEPVDTVDPTSE